ncbi:MAG: hypothetical protein JO063_14155 [Pseudonocardiales bacterium]|nr:hypothetical protein [Pseudonocardiales bacterium]MBV9031992.1 hypothetical protein [Pseudonocardiales bacterium]MBW0011229.1 hypothetical protein [Pseudonocardiales bacterium]
MRPPPSPELRAQVRAKVAASRTAQGLPPVVTDPATLERVAAVFRLMLPAPVMRSPRTRRRTAAARRPQGGAA